MHNGLVTPQAPPYIAQLALKTHLLQTALSLPHLCHWAAGTGRATDSPETPWHHWGAQPACGNSKAISLKMGMGCIKRVEQQQGITGGHNLHANQETDFVNEKTGPRSAQNSNYASHKIFLVVGNKILHTPGGNQQCAVCHIQMGRLPDEAYIA